MSHDPVGGSGQSLEDSGDEVGYIKETQLLLGKAYRDVEMPVDALDHHQIVLLVRTVDACGTENYPRQIGIFFEEDLALELGAAVGGVGVGDGLRGERLESLFVAQAEHAQRRHVQEPPRDEAGLVQHVDKAFQIAVVDAVEVGDVGAFGGAEVPYYAVPAGGRGSGSGELRGLGFGVVIVEDDEVQARVVEVAPRGALPHAHIRLVSAVEGHAGQETADKAAGAHDEYAFAVAGPFQGGGHLHVFFYVSHVANLRFFQDMRAGLTAATVLMTIKLS